MTDPGSIFRRTITAIIGYPGRVSESFRAFRDSARTAIAGAIRSAGGLHWLALGLIVLCGLIVRIAHLDRPMDYDESVTFIRFVLRPLPEALSNYSLLNNHLLNTVLTRISYLLFGAHPWVVRLPALVAGVLLAPAGYVLGRTFTNKNAGLLTAALLSGAAYLVEYSASGRGYTMLALFFVLALIVAGRLARAWSAFGMLAIGLLGSLMVYTVPTGIYPLAIILVWLGLTLLIERREASSVEVLTDGAIALGLMGALTVLLYLPVLLNRGVEEMASSEFLEPMTWAAYFDRLLIRMPEVWGTWTASMPVWAAAILGIGCVAGVIVPRRVGQFRVPLMAVSLVTMLAMITVQRLVPPERMWLYMEPVFLVTAAAGLVEIGGWLGRALPTAVRGWAVAIPVAAAIFLGWQTHQNRTSPYWYVYETPIYAAADHIAMTVGGDIGPDDAILTISKDFPSIRFYLFEHYGEAGLDFANWSQIAQGGLQPARVYIIVAEPDGVPEGAPEDGIRARGLDPAEYTTPEVIDRANDVALYVAYRR